MTAEQRTSKLRAMTDHGTAIDLYIGELARRSRSEATRHKYWQVLNEFAAFMERRGRGPGEATPDDCKQFLDQYTRTRPPRRWQRVHRPPVSASTLALYVSVLRGYFEFLEDEQIVPVSPAAKLKRPRRKRPEDVAVVTTSGGDVMRMFTACDPDRWDELLCVATVCYLGPRRNALAQAKRGDLDLDAGLIRFREKGGKETVKPVPHDLAEIYRAAEQAGVWLGPRDYLIPNRRPKQRAGERSNKVVYEIVKRVAAKARVDAHPHSLRAAFAVQFDEQKPDQVIALKELLGHSRIETTMVYLRRKDKAKAMEQVRDLSWGSRLPPRPDTPPAGFEPAFQPSGVPDPIRRKLDELRAGSTRMRTRA